MDGIRGAVIRLGVAGIQEAETGKPKAHCPSVWVGWRRTGFMAARYFILTQSGRAHQRLWNRSFTIKPIPAKRYADDLKAPSRFYAQAVIIQALLKTIAPDSQWSQRLVQLMAEHPKVPAHRMGFPADWQTREIWLP